MKNNLFIIAAFLVLAIIIQWLIGPLCNLLPSSLSVDIGQLPRDGTLKLYYAVGKGYTDNNSVCMQVQKSSLPSRIVFHLPADLQPSSLMVSLREQQGDIMISGMDFGYYHWGPTDIVGSFVLSADTGSVEVNNQAITIHAKEHNPYLTSIGSLDYVYSYLSSRAAVIRSTVFLLSLLAFFALVILLNKKGWIDRNSSLSILRLSIFYCVCILLFIPTVYTSLKILNVSKMPVFTVFETKPDIPKFDYSKALGYLKIVDPYFSKYYSFRDLFIRWTCSLSVRLLDESAVPLIISGKDGWNFLNQDLSLNDHQGLIQLNQKQLKSIKQQWTDIKTYLDSKGIFSLVVFAPDKETVYPEFLPERLGPFAAVRRLDQIIDEMRTIPGFQYIDLRSTLKLAKEQYPLYDKDNSHWNTLGAFIGYQEIARHLAPKFGQVVVPEIGKVVTTEYIHGYTQELSYRMNMAGEFPDSQVALTIEPQIDTKIIKPKLLIFHDSFAGMIWPFFTEHFKTVVSAGMSQKFDTAIVDREQPDAVIFIMVERCGVSNLLPAKLE